APYGSSSRAPAITGGDGTGNSGAPSGQHEAVSQVVKREPPAHAAPGSGAASTVSPTRSVPVNNEQRPPLPQRHAQTHLAPQLREAPEPRNDEPNSDHSPGLMAAFQDGFSRAEKEDASSPGHGTDTTS